jgi:hypothetical protein
MPDEFGIPCLFSCLFSENRDVLFPKLNESLPLITFSEIAIFYRSELGYKVPECKNEDEARNNIEVIIKDSAWSCLFTSSDTTGEKDLEDFFIPTEILDFDTFSYLGII